MGWYRAVFAPLSVSDRSVGLWLCFSWALSLLYAASGLIYAVGGRFAISGNTLSLVAVVERNLHVHGALMMALGVGSAAMLTHPSLCWRYQRHFLLAMAVYQMWVWLLVVGESFRAPISYTALVWYVFAAALAVILYLHSPFCWSPPVRDDRSARA